MGARGIRPLLTVVAVVGAALAGPAVAATSSSDPPAPTASVATYLPGGTQVPVNTIDAAWSHVRRGCFGILAVTGKAVSGTTSVATADFLSRTFRLRGPIAAFAFATERQAIVDALPEGTTVHLRLRQVPGHWSPWFGSDLPANPPQPVLITYGEGGAMLLSAAMAKGAPRPTLQVQLRITDRITSTGTVGDSFHVGIGCR